MRKTLLFPLSLFPLLLLPSTLAASPAHEAHVAVAEAELIKAYATKDASLRYPYPYPHPPRSGLRRLLVGVVLLTAALVHMTRVTYPKVMPFWEKGIKGAQDFTNELLGLEKTSDLEYTAKRYMKYAEEEPVIVGAELGALLVGLMLVISGLRRLHY